MIHLTDSAIKALKEKLVARNTPDAYIRLGVKGAGCKGFTYVIQFEDNKPREKDIEFSFDDVKVLIDKKSILYLEDSILDFEKTFIAQGFKFTNPNEQSKCWCGQSFAAEPRKAK